MFGSLSYKNLNPIFCSIFSELMMKGERGSEKKKHFKFHLRLQFLIISMTMKGENKQTLISQRTFLPEGPGMSEA